jgi:hypothetical protein
MRDIEKHNHRLFVDRFRGYGGPVYVLNPDRSIAEMIENRLKSPYVIWVPEKWNVLSAAMMDRILGDDRNEPLRDAYPAWTTAPAAASRFRTAGNRRQNRDVDGAVQKQARWSGALVGSMPTQWRLESSRFGTNGHRQCRSARSFRAKPGCCRFLLFEAGHLETEN